MSEGALLAIRTAQAIVADARASARAASPSAPAPSVVVRMAGPDDPSPFYVSAPRRRMGVFVALGMLAFALGFGIFGR